MSTYGSASETMLAHRYGEETNVNRNGAGRSPRADPRESDTRTVDQRAVPPGDKTFGQLMRSDLFGAVADEVAEDLFG